MTTHDISPIRKAWEGKVMKIVITTYCGKNTCAAAPGKFCRFVCSTVLGTKPICALYSAPLWEVNGWLRRCEECLKENMEDKHEAGEAAERKKEHDK